jgi:predicted alpha/beta-hydrolase family hydrolase
MTTNPTLIFNSFNTSKRLVILTHGASEGIENSFIQNIIHKFNTQKVSVLALQMPFKDRGENSSSGSELLEELDAVNRAMEMANFFEYDRIDFIGKSLGGIIFSKFLNSQNVNFQTKTSLTILGYIYGDVEINNYSGKLFVIQGENDKYGSKQDIEKDLNNSISKDKNLIIIPNADHSYRNENKEPVYQRVAVEMLK